MVVSKVVPYFKTKIRISFNNILEETSIKTFPLIILLILLILFTKETGRFQEWHQEEIEF